MSQAEDVPEVPDYWEDVDEWASSAVRGANNWLVTIRNATDEGITPWSDYFTGDKNGLMSRSEGLTALAIVKQIVNEKEDLVDIDERSDFLTLRDRLYRDDFQDILDELTAEDGPRLKPDPYLEEVETDHFTVAATFSTSAIIETLKAGVDLGEDISDSDIEEGLKANIEWLLENRIEDVDTPDAAGWSWFGTESSRYEADVVEPMNYFTYSASLVLCDLISNRNHPIIGSAVAPFEDEIRTAINQANNFLLKEYWEEDEGAWGRPRDPSNPVSDEDKLLSTCYAFVGLSYIEATLDSIDVSDEQEERMGAAMDWALQFYDDNPFVWATVVKYSVEDEEFTDGSAPYVLLDAIVELVNYRPELAEYISDYDVDGVEEVATDRLAPTILSRCWAGDEMFQEKGFRHIGDGKRLLNNEDGAPDYNPTAIYSTGVAIETFLLNFLKGGDLLEFPDYTASESTEATDIQPSVETTGQTVENRTVNNIIFDGEGGGYPDEVNDILQNIQSEIQQLSTDVRTAAGDDGGVEKAFEERNLEFMTELMEFLPDFLEEYDNAWNSDVIDNLGGAKQPIASSLQSDWEQKFRSYNTDRFLEFLSELYFCPDRETFEEEVQVGDDIRNLMLPPQRDVVEEVADWDEEKFTDAEDRKAAVEGFLEEFQDEPWGGEGPVDAAMAFSKRFQDEN